MEKNCVPLLLNQSLSHSPSLFDAPGTKGLALWNIQNAQCVTQNVMQLTSQDKEQS